MMRLPIGIDDFKEIRDTKDPNADPYFYCDKTLMIKDIIREGPKVMLFTRPRRFGKTLNMSMLKYFFGTDENLFEGLDISEYKSIIDYHRNKYIAVFITFKKIQSITFESFLAALKVLINVCYHEHLYLMTSDKLDAIEKNILRLILKKILLTK